MTKVTRIVLASLISLAVIIGIYTSVEGASLAVQHESTGTHAITRTVINLDQFRSPEVAPASMNANQTNQTHKGHGCDSDIQPNPDD
jgi:hypothetical protein